HGRDEDARLLRRLPRRLSGGGGRGPAGLRRLLPVGGAGVAAVRGGGGRLLHRPGPAAVAGPGRTAPRRGDRVVSGAPASLGRITGAARLGGIVGNPVRHSLSPVIHNAWLEAGGIDGAYVAFAPGDPAGFRTLVAAGRAGLIAGVNVTAPFKEQAFALADEVGPAARLTGSANILVFEDGRVRADS